MAKWGFNEAIDLRDRAKLNAKAIKNVENFETYKILRHQAISLIRELKTAYYLTLENLTNSVKLWKAIKKIIPASTSVQPHMLNEHGPEHTESSDISNCFKLYFSSIDSNLVAPFQNHPIDT